VIESGGGQQSPIVTILPRTHGQTVVDKLRALHVSVAPRGGGVRVSPHVYCTPAHIEQFFELFDAVDR
jgi:hypothetical protein